jgi:thiol:disulfide interchange protein DsbC
MTPGPVEVGSGAVRENAVNSRWQVLIFGVPIAGVLAGVAVAQEPSVVSKEALAAQLPGVAASDISDAPIPGFYQIAVGASVAYVSQDGRYALQGELYDLETSANLTEELRADKRVALLEGVDRSTAIVFRPKDGAVKHRVTIFTDVDCGYCRQFHREIDQVTALGIEVEYLSFPRTGPDTESWSKAEHVWCAKDRAAALTQAKLGGSIPEESCDSTPVESHYNLGNLVGVRGTPAVYAATGELLGGYLPPDKLLEALEQLAH